MSDYTAYLHQAPDRRIVERLETLFLPADDCRCDACGQWPKAPGDRLGLRL